MKIRFTFLLLLSITMQVLAQTNETPERLYEWKKKKQTEFQEGYVVLKSGKRLDGQISLKGYYKDVQEVFFIGEKEINFPVKALKKYGLNIKTTPLKSGETLVNGIINESQEDLYEWKSGGIIMNKVVKKTVPRKGYVVTKNQDKIEGELRVQKRDDQLWNFVVKIEKKKHKFKADEILRYGLTVSKEEIQQANLAKVKLDFYKGSVGVDKKIEGKIGIYRNSFKVTSVVLETSSGERSTYKPNTTKGFEVLDKEGTLKKYIAVDEYFIEEEFNGNVFQLYRNPKPTTINKFLTGLVKTGVSTGTSIIAREISKADQKKNNYKSNIDSIINVSSKEQLITMREGFLSVGGYKSVDEMNNKSNNESLKNNVNAVELAIAGKEFSESEEGGIYNKEWVILNKKTGEKTIVYKKEYKELIEPLLFGCYEFLSFDKKQQKKYLKWDDILTTLNLLDNCY